MSKNQSFGGLDTKKTLQANSAKLVQSVFTERSTFSAEYQAFLRHLRNVRRQAGLTQVEVGQRLGVAQAIISKCERGERRLDIIELRAYCIALEVSYLVFLADLENILGSTEQQN